MPTPKPTPEGQCCPHSFSSTNLQLSWAWESATPIRFAFVSRGSSWVAFGLGTGMDAADVVMARTTGTGVHVEQRRSTTHALPALLPTPYALDMRAQLLPDGALNVTFALDVSTMPSEAPKPSLTGPTRVIFASLDAGPGYLVQHTQ